MKKEKQSYVIINLPVIKPQLDSLGNESDIYPLVKLITRYQPKNKLKAMKMKAICNQCSIDNKTHYTNQANFDQ